MSTQEFYSAVSSLQDSLKSYSYRFASNQDDSNDLIQETVLKALAHKDKFESNTNLKAWMFTIMKNIFINDYNKNTRRNSYLEYAGKEALANVQSSSKLTTAESSLMTKDILVAINKLKPELRKTFNMYLEGFKYREIAEEMNISIGTIKTRIFLARKFLTQELHMYSPNN